MGIKSFMRGGGCKNCGGYGGMGTDITPIPDPRGRLRPDSKGVLRNKRGQSYNFGPSYDPNDPDGQRTNNQHSGGFYHEDPYEQASKAEYEATMDFWDAPRGDTAALQRMQAAQRSTQQTREMYGDHEDSPWLTSKQRKNRKDRKEFGNKSYHQTMEEGKANRFEDPFA